MQQPEPVCLLIADISGYTRCLAAVELDHAHDILADLIGTVVTALRPTFRLAKLEGDAAFVVAPAGKLDGTLLLDTVERCYFGFRRRRRDVRQATSCPCNACTRIPDLNLKFVIHDGLVMRQRMAGREELVGSDVIVVHRLPKNDVAERLGIGAYALFTQAGVDAVAIEPTALGMQPLVETYEHVGEVGTWVLDLERRWQEEEARQRVFVAPVQSWFTQSASTVAPPSSRGRSSPPRDAGRRGRSASPRSSARGPGTAAPWERRTTAGTARRAASSRRSSTGVRTTTSPIAAPTTRPRGRRG
jgi:hypothetical protein